ncbi:MAG: carbon-nitrogen hydrolase family protein [Kiritimatiellia bacterium]
MMLKTCSLMLALTLTTTAFAAAAVDESQTIAAKPIKSRRKIVVSSLGPELLMSYPAKNEQAVELMKNHWKTQLAFVLPEHPDLIVLPEACDRFPTMSFEQRLSYYEYRGNKMRDFFCKVAQENKCYIAYSAARKLPDGTWRNSTQLIDRKGEIVGIYNKNYTTVGENERWGIIPGKDAPVFQTDFGRVTMAICFDLNFHELLERCAIQRPDLVIFSSMYHGGLMQNYWAYHCRSFFVGSIARDENNIIDPLGQCVARSTNYFKYISTEINLDYQVVHLDYNWKKLDAAKAKYGRGVTISDPGHLGSVLLTSNLDEVTSADIVKEFDIELWDDYYKRATDHRNKNVEP